MINDMYMYIVCIYIIYPKLPCTVYIQYMCIHIYYTIWIVWEVVPYLYISLWIYTFALFGKNFLLPSWCFSAPHRGVPVRRLARDIAAPWSERPIPHPNSG